MVLALQAGPQFFFSSAHACPGCACVNAAEGVGMVQRSAFAASQVDWRHVQVGFILVPVGSVSPNNNKSLSSLDFLPRPQRTGFVLGELGIGWCHVQVCCWAGGFLPLDRFFFLDLVSYFRGAGCFMMCMSVHSRASLCQSSVASYYKEGLTMGGVLSPL